MAGEHRPEEDRVGGRLRHHERGVHGPGHRDAEQRDDQRPARRHQPPREQVDGDRRAREQHGIDGVGSREGGDVVEPPVERRERDRVDDAEEADVLTVQRRDRRARRPHVPGELHVEHLVGLHDPLAHLERPDGEERRRADDDRRQPEPRTRKALHASGGATRSSIRPRSPERRRGPRGPRRARRG